MTIKITLPDGAVANFPDGTDEATISKAISGHLGQAASAPQGGGIIDTLNDATTGVGQGVSLGFGDELNSAIAAPFRAVGKKVMAGDWKAPGLSDYGDAYNTELEHQRKILHEAETRSPTATAVGEGLGALTAMPQTAAAAAPTLGRAMLQGARDAGIYGSAYGVGTGEGTESRVKGGLVGGLTGATVGAGVPLVMAGGSALAQPIRNTIRGITNPEAEAARQGLTAIRADRATPSPTMLTDQEFAAGAARGQPVTNAELGGENTAALARKAANISPTARATLNQTIDRRFTQQSDRVGSFVRNLVGGNNAAVTREAMQAQAVTENAARYRPAMRAGNRVIDSPELARLTNSPDMQAAIRAADPAVTSRAIAEGGGAGDIPTIQNLQFWDAVKRRLDAGVARAERAGDGEAVQRLTLLNNSLTAELDRQVPEYAAARAGAAVHFGAQDALQAGQNFVTSDINQAARNIAQFSPSERRLFGEGFADSLIKKIEKTGDRRNVVHALFESNDMRDRVRLALGPDRARQLEAYLRVEFAMDALRTSVQGNSTTARQLVELLGLSGLDNAVEGRNILDPRGLVLGAVGTRMHVGRHAFTAAQAVSNARVAPRIAHMLMSHDPNVFNAGVRLVARNPRWMQALRAFGAASGAVASQHPVL